MTNSGRLVVISGPSGAGKSQVLKRLLASCPLPLELSISATTREPRQGEVDGVDYHFLAQAEFDRLREDDKLLEFAEVFSHGHWYGTLKNTVATGLAGGKWVILEIDVAGMEQVVGSHPQAITIFLHAGSLEELERRLRGRGTETEAAVQRRLATARSEMEKMDRYRYVVVNDVLERAAGEICDILLAERGIEDAG